MKNILEDGAGRTLYLFTRDERNKSNCTGQCAQRWPPLLTKGAPKAGEGLTQSLLGTIMRADGATQVAYNGWPLYYWFEDVKPGDTKGQNVGGVWFVLSPDGSPVYTTATVKRDQDPTLRTILADASGRTLYLYTRDERNKSNCAGQCAQRWPPLLTKDAPKAEEGVTESFLGTITRADGFTQVTYNGWPLYYWFEDVKPGDTKGQNVGGVWYVLTPDGSPVYTTATVNRRQHSTLGAILADASGRSLYMFTRDEPNVSNCAGGCARAWPPLLSIDAPKAGEGLNAELLGRITRTDGSRQVTYNGRPLYYWFEDEKPGDTKGQNVGGVWYVVSPQGEAIKNGVPSLQEGVAQQANGAKLEWFGWSHFRITTPEGMVIHTNPFITNNPDASIKLEDITKADLILVPDGHGDELGDTIALAQKTGAKVLTGGFELGSWLIQQGVPAAQVQRGNPGDRHRFGKVTVRVVNSVHGSGLPKPTIENPYGGPAAGFIISLEDGYTIYFAGSTAATTDMQLWGSTYKPHLAILPLNNNRDPMDVALMAQLLRTNNPNLARVIPHHQRVQPPAGATTVAEMKEAISGAVGTQVQVMELERGKPMLLAK